MENLLKLLSNLINLIISIIKGDVKMVDMYLALVIAGRRTCNPETAGVTKVPERYREAVLEELTALGLDADGNPVVA